MVYEKFLKIGEYAASGAFEEPERSLFYRKALGIRRFYENCPLCEYRGERLYPSGVFYSGSAIYPYYLNGLGINYSKVNENNRELIEIFKKDFCRYASKVPAEHAVAGNMYCHSFPNYARIAKEGLNSYAERIKNNADKDFREGLLHIYEGIKRYAERCAEYLESVNADPELIRALKKVPLKKADNIYEALVCRNFVMYLDNCDNIGCLAKDLYEFYNGEDIVPLLENLFDNLDANDGYSMALGTDYNELTIQCLKAARGKRRPMIELFVDKNTPDDIWNEAFETMRSHGGQPAFYNPLLPELLKQRFNINDKDIKNFCGGGCTESMIAGYSNVGSLDAGINLLLILENTMYKFLACCKSFDEFYGIYITEVCNIVNDITERISLSQKERSLFEPLPMRTFLIDDCIDTGVEYNNGGARYNWSIINFAGLINVIDSLLVIRDIVFDGKAVSAEELLARLKNNDEAFLSLCRKNKNSFGADNGNADKLANMVSTEIFSMLDNKKPYIGKGFIPASIQFMSQVDAGRNIGATPDGRKAGAPLCDSLAAIFGKDCKGPTALLKSVTSLALKKVLGTPILNFNIDESWSNDVLKAMILTYMQMGGIQMQITCISEKMLKEAYENPESHRNLVVRVGGYSEYFCRLSDELKKMILNRTVQKEN